MSILNAQEAWRLFQVAVLHDITMDERERHLVAAAYWCGLASGITAAAEHNTEDFIEALKIVGDDAASKASRTLACIQERHP